MTTAKKMAVALINSYNLIIVTLAFCNIAEREITKWQLVQNCLDTVASIALGL